MKTKIYYLFSIIPILRITEKQSLLSEKELIQEIKKKGIIPAVLLLELDNN